MPCIASSHCCAEASKHIEAAACGRLNVLVADMKHHVLQIEATAKPASISLSATRRIVTLDMALPGRVVVLPAITIVAAIGVRIARPQVLTICIRVELRA